MKYLILCLLVSQLSFAETLSDQLSARRAEFKEKAPADVQKLYEESIDRLKELKLPDSALKLGATMPKNTLTQEKGKFLVVTFYRGGWCPYCMLQLKAFEKLNKDFVSANSKVLALAPQSPNEIKKTKKTQGLSFELKSDKNLDIARRFGIVFKVEPAIVEAYKKHGIDLSYSHNELPLPATFVFDKSGKVIFSYVDADYRLRAEPQQILDLIKAN